MEVRDHKKTALIYKGKEISYSELIENIGSFATLIDTLPDERILIISENRPEWIYTLFGAWRKGTIVVPVDFMSSPEEIAYIIEDSEPKIIFCSNETEEKVKEALKISDKKIEVVNFDKISLPKPTLKSVHREKDDIALILYTSGTTGNPKGVMLTFGNLMSNIEGVVDANIASKEDSTLAILPFHHSYPLMVTILVPLYIGATIVFLDKLSPEDILEKLRRYRISIIVGVPRLYELFHKRIMERIENNFIAKILFKLSKRIGSKNLRRKLFKRVHEAFGGNVKYMVSGGAKLDIKVAEDLETLGFTILEGYGLTETSPIVSFNSPDNRKLGSVGLPIKGVLVRTTNEEEILVKGPNVMRGYWKDEETTKKVIKNGWLYTGDLGYIDEDGFLYITGRKKELIVLGTGKNVFPEELEKRILRQTDIIKEVGVLEVNGKLHAIIYPDFEKIKEKGIVNIYETIKWEVIDKVNRELPEWKRIVGFKIVDTELPKTRLGKLKRFLLKEIYEKGTLKKEEKEDLSIFNTQEGKLIKEFLEKETKKEVKPSHHIEIDLGMDSLAKLELLSFIEKTFGIKLSEEDIARYGTVKELIEFIKKKKTRIETEEVSWKEILEKAEPFKLYDFPLIFEFGRRILYLFFRLYNRVEVRGIENLPEKPFILAPNHASYVDAFVIASVLPKEIARDTYFLGEEAYFKNPITSLFGKLAHVITVNVNRKLKESLQKVAFVLKLNKVVVIFPEGARTRTGELMEFKPGIAILSKELNVPVVPVALKGTYEVMSIYDKFPKPKKIEVIFGKPVYPDDKSYDEILKEVRKIIEKELKT